MASIADIDVPADGTGLSELFDTVPELTCEMEQVIASDGHELWLSGDQHETIRTALDRTSAIEEYSLITSDGSRWLYNVDFAADVVDVFDHVLEAGGTVLSASASDNSWRISIRFVQRECVSSLFDRLHERDVRPQILRLYELSDDTYSQYGLTKQQYETLVAAINNGYFEIPREVSMQELSDELDISHQALSERLRRAYRALVAAELDVTDDQRSTPKIPST